MSIGMAVDPGLSTGIVLFGYGTNAAFHVYKIWQVPMGAEGIGKFIEFTELEARKNGDIVMKVEGYERKLDALIMERFTPRPNSTFNQTRKSVESLRGEGAFLSRGFGNLIQWAEPSQQYFMGDPKAPLAEKKKLSRAFLKQHGLYATGSQVGMKDADDVISATLHGIAWLRRQRHLPTLRALFGEEQK